MTKLAQLKDREEFLASQVVDIAIAIHRQLGPGLLESVYEKVFSYELKKRDIPYSRQTPVPVTYDSIVIDDGLRLDLLLDELVIVELKAQENYHPVWQAQVLSYLKLTGK